MGHKNRNIFRGVVEESFFLINSINFNLEIVLGEFLKML
jgi:hypothetical protein